MRAQSEVKRVHASNNNKRNPFFRARAWELKDLQKLDRLTGLYCYGNTTTQWLPQMFVAAISTSSQLGTFQRLNLWICSC